MNGKKIALSTFGLGVDGHDAKLGVRRGFPDAVAVWKAPAGSLFEFQAQRFEGNDILLPSTRLYVSVENAQKAVADAAAQAANDALLPYEPFLRQHGLIKEIQQ